MPGFRGLTVGRLAGVVGFTRQELEQLADASECNYRLVKIRTGEKCRQLSIPSEELKALQRTLLDRLFYQLPAPECLGYTRGRRVERTLRRHEGDSHLFHADIKDFFPNVTDTRVRKALIGLKVRPEAAELLTRLVTHQGSLPQGAPTSVAVGDAVLYPIDRRLMGLASAHRLTYSRYIDDLTLSGPGGTLARFSEVVVDMLTDAGWELSQKGGLFGPDQSHRMLNAIVNRKPNVTREYYRSVRDALRSIARFGYRPPPDELDSLAAKVVWIATVNPDRHPSLMKLLEDALERVNDVAEDAGYESVSNGEAA